MYFNARSINGKQAELIETLDYYKPDIVGISETWLKDNANLTALTNDFHIYRQDRLCSNGGGVLLAIRCTLQSKLVKSCITGRAECIFVDVKFNKSDYIRYVVIYRPPDTGYTDSLALYNILYNNLKNCKYYVLSGDFNLPDISWADFTARSEISREFLTLCFKLGAEQCVNFLTREI